MRITFVLPVANMAGGVRVVAIYAKHLSRRGHEVTIVSLPPRPLPVRRKVRSLLQGKGWPRDVVRKPSHLDGVNATHRVLDRHRAVENGDVPDGDVVVATWWRTAPWVAALSPARGAKVHFIQHHETWGGRPEEVDATFALPLRKIVVARWLQKLVREKSGAEAVVVPNAVDLEQFNTPPRNKQARPTVGLMYSHAAFKGTACALEAFELARRQMPNLQLVAFGTEPPHPSHPLPADAVFALNPPQSALRDYYSRCDAWIFASRSEGFGLPILEAMACRTPVVATPTGAAPELLRGGGGVLLDRFDAGAIADGLVRIGAATQSDWQAMSQAAHATAGAYSWEQATDRMERALCEAASLPTQGNRG